MGPNRISFGIYLAIKQTKEDDKPACNKLEYPVSPVNYCPNGTKYLNQNIIMHNRVTQKYNMSGKKFPLSRVDRIADL